MINFIVPKNSFYKEVLMAFIQEMLPFLSDYEIGDKAHDNCVNIMFFTENSVFEECGTDKVKNAINCFYTHGIADKNWRDYHRVDKFDYVFVSGDAWIDKLTKQGMDRDKILLGGYTRLDKIYRLKDSFYKEINGNKKTMLFAPTHTCSVTSYDKLNILMDFLSKEYNVIHSPHPAQNKCKTTDTSFLEADVVVGDFGSSMYEAWTLGKPSVLPNWLVKEDILKLYPTSFEAKIYSEEIGYHAKSEDDFIKQIKLACDNGITQNEIDFIDGIFNPDLRGCGGIVTGGILKKLERLIK